MIRMLQLAVNRRTRDLNKQVVDKKLPDEKATMEHKKLARRQEAVRDMVDKLNKKMARPRPTRRGAM